MHLLWADLSLLIAHILKLFHNAVSNRHKQKRLNNAVFTKTEQRLNFLMRILVLINVLLISRLMSASALKLSLMTCPKYLNCDTHCSEIPPIVNTGKERDKIISRRLGVA